MSRSLSTEIHVLGMAKKKNVSNYSKDCSSLIGEQFCAAAVGKAEMCLIDGEKYESRAQRNTLSTFFGPIGF